MKAKKLIEQRQHRSCNSCKRHQGEPIKIVSACAMKIHPEKNAQICIKVKQQRPSLLMDIAEKDFVKLVAAYEAMPDNYGTTNLRNTA